METSNALRIACKSPESLAERITKAPFHLMYDSNELARSGYQTEGVIVPELDKSEPLTTAELNAIATDYDMPDALRFVKVPQRTGAFAQALGRSGMLFGNELGTVTIDDMTSFAQALPGRVNTTINPAIGRYVGMHIDVTYAGQDRSQMMMGVVCGEAGRGLTFCPDITADVISPELQYAQTAEERLERREQIRRAAARLQGKAACYTVWLEGSGPNADTYEAYANFQPFNMLHDGTSYRSRQPATIQLLKTHTVTAASFESVV